MGIKEEIADWILNSSRVVNFLKLKAEVFGGGVALVVIGLTLALRL